MTDPVDRDRQVEHLLRQSMPAGRPVSSPCLDAERLAAWSTGGLRREEAATVERHLADCADCQAMLAAFVESEPVPSVAAAPFWQRWSMRWLVPVAAASAAVLVWAVATREHADVVEPSTTMARAEPGNQPPVEVSPFASAPVAQSAIEAAPPPVMPEAAVPSPAVPAPSASTADLESREMMTAAPAPGATAARQEVARAEQAKAAAPAPPPRPPSELVAEGAASARLRAEPPPASAMPTAPLSSPPAPTAAPGVVGQRVGGLGQNNVMMDGFTAIDMSMPAHARAGVSPVQFSSSVQLGVRWRIDPDGLIERSSDRGQTWTRVVLEPPTRITAGSAPAANTAWIVGRDGGVFRSTDGMTFMRRPFPASVDLATVVAQDAARATVTTEDGRAFSTADGGETWQQR